MLEQTLAASPYLAGPELTCADIMVKLLSHIAADVRRPRRPPKCAILCRAREQAARLRQGDADCRTHGRTA